jgi:hypothetical protein
MKINVKTKTSKFEFKIKWNTFCGIHSEYNFNNGWKSAPKGVM